MINIKKISIIISLVLVFTIILNFSVEPKKVYADAVILSGIGLKFLLTVLAGIGLLKTLEQSDLTNSFLEGFKHYYDNLYGAGQMILTLSTLAVSSIYENTKVKVTDIVNDIKKYFENEFYSLGDNYEVEGDLLNSYNYVITVKDLPNYHAYSYDFEFSDYSRTNVLYDKKIEGTGDYSDYSWYIVNSYTYDEYYKSISYHVALLESYKGYLTNAKGLNTNRLGNHWGKSSHIITMESSLSISNTNLYLYGYSFNHTNNVLGANIVRSLDFDDAFPILHSYLNDYPLPKYNNSISYYPEELALPWENGLVIDEHIGSTVDSLVESIASVPTKSWIEELVNSKYGELTKEINEIIVDEQTGLITDIQVGEYVDTGGGEVVDPEIPPYIPDLDLPDSVSLDFSPLLDIPLDKKFPFSLPWDIKRSVEILQANGKAPKWEIPILTETLVIDFSTFESLASIVQAFSILIFILALILISRRIIGS